jgi:ABC-type polysaccharide/polyol phosphate transport system ATPase subunit
LNVVPAIEVTGVGKRFVKYEDTPMLVSRLLQLRNRTRRSALWALRGADFAVEPGEAVGVVGRNGSGKTTLLSMLAGTTAPTEGRVTVRGRIAPLISVGVGFHPELNGRENVYVNGTILGLTRREIDERFDDIVAFSEIGDFIDTPVKFYSSGMFVRLGFAVSAMAEPDVLLIDEVLAVGDLAFQLKCFERLETLRAKGTTTVLVTHNLNAVRRLCDRLLVVHNGEIRHDGDVVEGLSLYHELLGQPRDLDEVRPTDSSSSSVEAAVVSDTRVLGPDGAPTHHAHAGDELTVEATVTLERPVDRPILGFNIVTEAGVQAYGERFALDGDGTGLEVGVPKVVRVSFVARLATGSYSLQLSLGSVAHIAIARPVPAMLLFVEGRSAVRGVADVGAGLSIDG